MTEGRGVNSSPMADRIFSETRPFVVNLIVLSIFQSTPPRLRLARQQPSHYNITLLVTIAAVQ